MPCNHFSRGQHGWDQDKSIHRLAGYAALIDRYRLDVIPNWHQSFVVTSGTQRIDSTGNVIEESFPAKYWPGDTLGDHLEFAYASKTMAGFRQGNAKTSLIF